MADHRDERLEKLKEATSTLEPPDELTDRVMEAVQDDLAYVFERFRERTEALEPSDGLTGAIMHAVREATPPVSESKPVSSGVIWYDGFARSGVRALIVAAAVAAASVLYGSYVERDFDTHVVAAAEGDPAE